MDLSVTTAIVLIATLSYLAWGGYRLYLALGSCPRCHGRLNRTAHVCHACGCRPHERTQRLRSHASHPPIAR